MHQQAKKAYLKASMVIGAISGLYMSALLEKHDWVNAAGIGISLLAGTIVAHRHYREHTKTTDLPLRARTLLWKFLKTFLVVLIAISIVQVIYAMAAN